MVIKYLLYGNESTDKFAEQAKTQGLSIHFEQKHNRSQSERKGNL